MEPEPEPVNLPPTPHSSNPPENDQNDQSSSENHVMDSENHLSSDSNLQETSEPPSEIQPPLSTTPPSENTSAPPPLKRRRRLKQFPEMIPSAAAVNGLRVLRQHSRSSIYNEKLMDEILEMQIEDHTKSRKRRMADLAREVEIEALIAISVGFPVDCLTEEEIEYNVVPALGGVEQANYIIVRNHILARWRSNVTTWLSRDHALESIRSEHRGLVSSAYNFLFDYGYINFGLSCNLGKEVGALARLTAPPEGGEKASIVIIGAGLAGLAASRHLISLGFKVVVLEGRKRPGGRVRTRKMKGSDGDGDGGDGVVAAADLGGSVLTGINGNPLGVLARQLGFPLHKVRDICPLYLPSGKAVDSNMDSRIEVDFNRLLDKVCKLREEMLVKVNSVDVSLGSALEAFRHIYNVAEEPQERMLLNWHLANLEYANASPLSDLSMAFWDQDDPYEMGGDHCFIPGGNERFIRALAQDIPIIYDQSVEKIQYGSDGVMVYAGGQVYYGDMALCTASLGVLKKGAIEFVPELPQPKREAIQRLGFGLLNKVAMLFPYDFWGGEIDTFGHLTDDSSMRGEFFLFYSYSSVSGGPLLVALVAGESAVEFETMSPGDAVGRVLNILRRIFVPKGILVPNPLEVVCTRWGQDRFSYGSYSYVSIGAAGDDYDVLAESVGGRVFFAGEATNRRYPATMHGAFLSGLREAANMMRVANKRSLVALEKTNNVKDVNNATEISILGDENDDLDKLFETPDLSFGSFSVLFDPLSIDLDSTSLLRVGIGGNNLKSGSLFLYGLIQRKHVMDLNKLEGDGSRMSTLNSNFGVRLVGRKKLGSVAESLIDRIKAARANLDQKITS